MSNEDFIIFRNHDTLVAFYYFTGAVIVNADLGETKSLEKALEGADIMFLTTHYWEERNKEKEVIKVICSCILKVHQIGHIVVRLVFEAFILDVYMRKHCIKPRLYVSFFIFLSKPLILI